MQLSSEDKITMVSRCLRVNGKPFVVEFPDEPLHDVEDNKLVTLFRGHLTNYWNVTDIKGYFAI